MTKIDFEKLKQHRACSSAIEFLKTQPDLESAWANCKRADHMLWLARLDREGEQIWIDAAADCAQWAVDRYWTDKTDLRPQKAIDAARSGSAKERKAAADAAYDAAYDAARAADAVAARAADYAVAARDAARAAAYAAAYAARAAAYADDAACAEIADLVRARVPFAKVVEVIGC